MADYSIKQGDTGTVLTATLKDGGTAANLTGASVKFLMRERGSSTAKVNAAATIVTALEGEVSYTWAGTNLDTAGDYEAEWQVTYSGGAKQTFPNNGYLHVSVVDDIGD